MTIKANVAANFLGQGWRALMALAFVPIYIQVLGIESYGLIGLFAALQASLVVLDLGMKPTLSRELARFTGGAHDVQSICDLLRSIEVISLAIAVLFAIGAWAVSLRLATDWVQANKLPVDIIAQAFALMGSVAALQFIESIYTSCLVGLQKQVLQNLIISAIATLRGVGAIAILMWISPTLQAFFIWQGLVSLLAALAFAVATYRSLPKPPKPARFSLQGLMGSWRFAAGMMGITMLAFLLTNLDKLLLSRLLSLDDFGYYALAGVVATQLSLLSAPIAAAFYPRFTVLVTQGESSLLSSSYHQSAQLVSVLMGSTGIMLILFPDRILLVWTADPVLAAHVAPLLAVLALGNLLGGLTLVPYQMQLAHGWTALAIKVYTAAVIIQVPATVWAVSRYGPMGAAWIGVVLAAGYILSTMSIMHRRVLPTEKWRWFREDVAVPLVATTVTASLCHWMMPVGLSRSGELFILGAISGGVLGSAIATAPLMRGQVVQYLETLRRGSVLT